MVENERRQREMTLSGPAKPSKAFRKTVAVLLLGFLLLLGSGLGYMWFSSRTLRDTVRVIIHRDYTPANAFPDRSEVTVLFLGRDKDRDRRGQVLKTHGRTDAIMLTHFDFVRKTANLLSIPRDTIVRIPGRRGRHRINAAYAFGGAELAADTVFELLGVRPDAVIAVDYEGFIKGIDCVGGLNINVDKQLDYDDNWGQLHIHLKPGPQRLDGYQAMGFVRYRKSNDGRGDSDLLRIARQQEFLRAAKQKLMEPSTMLRLPAALDIVRDNVDTSLTFEQMCSVAYFVKQAPAGSIHAETLPGRPGRVVVHADEDASRELVRRMFY